VGIACILNGATVHSDALALFGFVLLGLGFSMAYRLGLLTRVRHTTPAEQAALSSKYAAVTYLPSMAGVLVGGALGNLVGLPAATYVLFGFGALALIPLMRFAPKLGEVG
jgi:predicted MFS family arabinose efflux permease